MNIPKECKIAQEITIVYKHCKHVHTFFHGLLHIITKPTFNKMFLQSVFFCLLRRVERINREFVVCVMRQKKTKQKKLVLINQAAA